MVLQLLVAFKGALQHMLSVSVIVKEVLLPVAATYPLAELGLIAYCSEQHCFYVKSKQTCDCCNKFGC